MNTLVCVKQVPNTTDIEMDANHSLVRDSTFQILNPADESALEFAFLLRDKFSGTVSVMSMGKKSAEGMLRETASRGADKLYLLNDTVYAGADTLATAHTLASAYRFLGSNFDLILCGRRSSDGETGQVGPELAALLDIPVITNATEIIYSGHDFQATRLLEDGSETLAFKPLALVTVCEWSCALRLPTIKGLKRAATMPVILIRPDDLDIPKEACGLLGSPTRVIHVTTHKAGVRHPDMSYDLIEGADEALCRIEANRG